MRRREFIALLGSGAAAWPLAARAQQSAIPVVGLLSPLAPGSSEHLLHAFRRGLAESGRIEGQNVAIDYRLASGFSRQKTDSRQALYAGIPLPPGLFGVTFAMVKNAGVRLSSGGRILCPKMI